MITEKWIIMTIIIIIIININDCQKALRAVGSGVPLINALGGGGTEWKSVCVCVCVCA